MAADDGLSAIVGRASGRLEKIRAALLVEMTARLRKLATKDGELVGEKDALDNARRIRTQLLTLMRDRGLPVVVSTAEAAIVDAVDAALRSAPRPPVKQPESSGTVGFTLDAEARASIERSVSGVLDDVADVFGEAQAAIRQAIDTGLSTAAPLDRVIDDVATALSTSFSRAAVGVETAIRGAGTKALLMQAERAADAMGEEIGYLYDGPEDRKTRPFCDKVVGKVYTLKALRRLDNGQGLPVDIHRGGYRCRHRLSPISLDDARDEGYSVVTE